MLRADPSRGVAMKYAKSRNYPRLLAGSPRLSASSKLERAKGFEPPTPTLASATLPRRDDRWQFAGIHQRAHDFAFPGGPEVRRNNAL
jgi:hypothetical protein